MSTQDDDNDDGLIVNTFRIMIMILVDIIRDDFDGIQSVAGKKQPYKQNPDKEDTYSAYTY